MTSDALTAKVISLSQTESVEPSFSVAAIPLALALNAVLTSADRVVWPLKNGGLAWKILSEAKKSGRAAKGGKVYWISCESYFPQLPDTDVPIIRIRLIESQISAAYRMPSSRLARRIGRLLGYEESALPDPGGAGGNLVDGSSLSSLKGALADNSCESFRVLLRKDSQFHNLGGNREAEEQLGRIVPERNDVFFLPSEASIEERFSAAAAISDCGVVPCVYIREAESALAAALVKHFFLNASDGIKRKAVFVTPASGTSIAFFRAVENLSVLTPVSYDDSLQAVHWALDSRSPASGPLLLIEPRQNTAPSLLKHPWETGQGVLLRKKNSGTLSRILLIVPGYMSKEALKAVNRLAKKDFPAAAISMRFLFPLDVQSLRDSIREYDIVAVADAFEGCGGLRASLALAGFFTGGSTAQPARPIVLQAPCTGKSMAEDVERIHRENRFRRTVDDVKRDQWR